jgi:predicted nucleic acid-binding protein
MITPDIPVYLALDTNYWIYLAKGDHSKIFEEIIKKINEGRYKIITCDYAIEEWDNGINKTREEIKKHIYEQSKNADEISNFLEGEEKNQFKQILHKYKAKEEERIKIANERIQMIDKIIKSNSIKAPITNEVKDLVIQHGLEKKAPFKTKNSTADALIFFSAVEYLKNNNEKGLANSIFVSYNHIDFSKSNNDKDTIHPDLEPFLRECSMSYERNIAKALNLAKSMEEEVQRYINDLIDDYIEDMIYQEAMTELDIKRGK